jgi:hypothetical protein
MDFTKSGKRIFKKKATIVKAVKTGRIMSGYTPRKVKGGYVATKGR